MNQSYVAKEPTTSVVTATRIDYACSRQKSSLPTPTACRIPGDPVELEFCVTGDMSILDIEGSQVDRGGLGKLLKQTPADRHGETRRRGHRGARRRPGDRGPTAGFGGERPSGEDR